MCPLIQNPKKANSTVVINNKEVKFDENGVGTIEDHDVWNQVLKLNGFEATEPEPEEEMEEPEEEPEEEVEETQPEEEPEEAEENDTRITSRKQLEDMRVVDLEDFAEENNIDLDGASLKKEIIDVIAEELQVN